MMTLKIEITNSDSLKALQELESRQLIRILQESEVDSLILPGKPMNEKDFKNWIEFAEDSPTVSLTEAKQRWISQKKKLRQIIH